MFVVFSIPKMLTSVRKSDKLKYYKASIFGEKFISLMFIQNVDKQTINERKLR